AGARCDCPQRITIRRWRPHAHTTLDVDQTVTKIDHRLDNEPGLPYWPAPHHRPTYCDVQVPCRMVCVESETDGVLTDIVSLPRARQWGTECPGELLHSRSRQLKTVEVSSVRPQWFVAAVPSHMRQMPVRYENAHSYPRIR